MEIDMKGSGASAPTRGRAAKMTGDEYGVALGLEGSVVATWDQGR
jgi:hypothetical protein